jgi:hypothetical protein
VGELYIAVLCVGYAISIHFGLYIDILCVSYTSISCVWVIYSYIDMFWVIYR